MAALIPLLAGIAAAVALVWLIGREAGNQPGAPARSPSAGAPRPSETIQDSSIPDDVALPLQAAPEPSQPDERPSLRVQVRGELVTLEARNVPLGSVIAALAEALGAEGYADPEEARRAITTSLASAPLDRALEQIADPLSYTVLWRRALEDDRLRDRPEQIIVYRPGHRSAVMKVASATNGGGTALARFEDDPTRFAPSELLVRLGETEPLSRFEQLAEKYGADSVDILASLRTARLRFPPGADVRAILGDLLDEPGVELAEPNAWADPVPDFVARTGPGLEDVRAELLRIAHAPSGGADAAAVAALLDSGVDPSYPALDGVILPGFDALTDREGAWEDDLGHGTAMAHVLSGRFLDTGALAEPVEGAAIPLLPVRMFSAKERGTYYDAAQAIVYAVDAGVRVINMSWAGSSGSALLDDAIAYAVARDVVLVAAVGNDGSGDALYPAAHPDVIGVSAARPDGSRFEFSNYGPQVSFAAGGEAVFPDSEPDRLVFVRGTSVASASLAHTVAVLRLESPDWDRLQVVSHLNAIAEDGGDPGPDPYFGAGVVRSAGIDWENRP